MKKYLKVNDRLFWLLLAMIIAGILIIWRYEGHVKTIFSGLTAVGTIGVTFFSVIIVFRNERKEKNEQLIQKAYQAYEKIIDLNNQIKDMHFFYATYKNYGYITPFSASYFNHERDIKDALGKLNYTAKKLLDSVKLTSAFMIAYLPENENFQKAECAIRGFVDVIQKINEDSSRLKPNEKLSIHTMEDKVEERNLNNAKEYLDNTLIDLNEFIQDEELKKIALQKQSLQSKEKKTGSNDPAL